MATNNRGGKREGAGKKPTGPIKIKVAYSLAPDVVEYLRSITHSPAAPIPTKHRFSSRRSLIPAAPWIMPFYSAQ